ncbi:hypothetical protein [Actinosynnema mirum]|uniref:Ig-like domain-containing protein n=1 Tax=Actinosynnema mirum (strain ATCC 29888 / DSM 43827 / JCM 3225 / NBRC 14064 / NCIMB 13271 / NRRL B-12336 / IMRU 3971 / 101) TaxID=446462 RepID=C6WRL4_ACTMD|nr:hypothetical protein [Actinosynnema mirum]ACU36856.1 hypothetical protein Amir_2935 [Actinosynnema mirum DSM 43827]
MTTTRGALAGLLAGCALALAPAPPAQAGDSPQAGNPAQARGSAPCGTSYATAPIEVSEPGLWTYTYVLAWCSDGTAITSAEQRITHREHSAACTWAGRQEESIVVGDGHWTAFDMSAYTCAVDGGTYGVNPWASVTFRPDGGYRERSGAERQ